MSPTLPQPSGTELLIWLGCAAAVLASLAFVLGLFNQAMKAREYLSGKAKRSEITPQPLEVREHAGVAMEKDCLTRYQANEKEISELKRLREKDDVQASGQRRAVYEKIEGVRTELIEQNENIRKELSTKIDDMPSKVVTLLKNTGAI